MIGNSIHDSGGERAITFAVDGATVEGNRIYNCVSVNLFVSGLAERHHQPELGLRQHLNGTTGLTWATSTTRR